MRLERIQRIEAFSIRLPRELATDRGTAGSPTALAPGPFDYRWSETNGALYSVNFETALVKVTLESGWTGWGEAQAPLAPDIACLIVDQLLRPAIEGERFLPTAVGVAALRQRMYATMRVRGQTGGFMLDAMAGVDTALWDLAGKISGRPIRDLIADSAGRARVRAYLSGLSGATNEDRVNRATDAWQRGFRTFKLFHDRSEDELFNLIDCLRARLGPDAAIAVDALWRLDESTAVRFGREIEKRSVLWLECPLPPESAASHAKLAEAIRTPLALGESYRSRHELKPFLDADSVTWIQPDLGRFGITEALSLARGLRTGRRIVPHISIAMGPQIAAALHLAAAVPAAGLAEYNPAVLTVANRFLTRPVVIEGAEYQVPSGPGLGIDIDERAVRAVAHRPVVLPLSTNSQRTHPSTDERPAD